MEIEKIGEIVTTAYFVGISHAYPHCTSRALDAHSSIYQFLGKALILAAKRPDQTIRGTEARTSSVEDAGEQKKSGNTLYAKKGKRKGSSTNDLFGLLDNLLHDFLDHGVALVLAVHWRILGQLG